MSSFLGTVYETVSLGEVRFSTKPGETISIGELVKLQIGGKWQLARVIDVDRRNYLIDEDTAVELSERFSEDDSFDTENLGMRGSFDDYTLGTLEIIGRIDQSHIYFERPRITPKMGTKIYIADKEFLNDQLRSDESSSIEIGTYIQNVQVPISVDIDELISKHFSVLAMTGSGKSWTVSVIIESIVGSGIEIPIIVFDPHGEYSSMMLSKDETGKSTSERIKIYVAAESTIKERLDKLFRAKWGQGRNSESLFVNITDLETYQMHHLLSSLYNLSEAQARILYAGWDVVRTRAGLGTNCESILEELRKETTDVTRGEAAWNIFKVKLQMLFRDTPFIRSDSAKPKMQLKSVVKKGQISVIDLSGMREIYQQAFVGMLANEILSKRIANEIPPVLCIFEEAHRFIPGGSGDTASKPALKRIAQEGRKFLVGMGAIS
jgi:DNA helicase HerA-like ATPase